jgi:hypothetical protein
MGRRPAGGMHIDRVRSRHTVSSGETRHYESSLLRRSYRKPDGKVGKQTLANLSMLPAAAVDAIDAVLKGKTLVEADAALQVSRSLPHGHVALVHAMATRLGLPALLGPACRERDLAYALVLSRVVHPKSKLATLSWWNDTTLGADLGVIGASRNEVYAAMDWLLGRQDAIEAGLSGRHLVEGGVAMFDLSSSWVEGRCCELAARGYSRDAKKGTLQIEYGLLTDPEGRPVAIRVFPGNTADPTAFTEAVQLVRDKFRLSRLTLIGDRGMITSARIEALRELGGLDWITCLRAPAIAKLAADDGPLQLSLFDQQDLAEITHPDYPGERLIACRNPHLATERARKREALLDATETLLAPLVTAVADGRLAGAGQIGIKTGKLINKFKMAKHFDVTITDTSLTITRRQAQITAEAALDGIYVLRTPVPATTLDAPATAPATVAAYKSLSHVEADFRSLKTIDADLHPIHHYLSDRVRAHVLICMLACYLTWHLRHALAELTYTHPRAITPSPPPPDPPTPRVRPAATTTTPASPCTTSAACSNTWPP